MIIQKYFRKLKEVFLLNEGYIAFLGTRKTVFFVVLAVLTSFFNSVNYIALIPLVSFVIDGSSLGGGVLYKATAYLPDGPRAIYIVSFVVILTFALKFLLNMLFAHFSGFYTERYMFFLRERMMKTMAFEYYSAGLHEPSRIMHFNNMIGRVGSFNWASFSMASKAISSLFLFISLVVVQVKLAGYSILFAAFWGAILIPVLKYTRKIAAEYTLSLHRVQVFLKDEIEGKEIIQIFNLQKTREERLKTLQSDAVRGNAYLSDIRALVVNLQEFIVVILGVVLICFAHAYKLQIGYLLAYGYVFSKFISTLNEVSTYLNNALEVMPPVQEIINYVDEGPSHEPINNGATLPEVSKLRFKNISFAWNKVPLFKLDELTLTSGDKLLISGKNGVGKSTLLKILAGLIQSSGKVSVNDQVDRSLPEIRALHQNFSYIPQSGIVFEGTLVENILLNSGKTIEDIKKLSTQLNISLSEYFSHWEEFQIHEDGSNLSGGELQIVSIFRALIRNYQVIFIDEFSNHLSEKVSESIDRYLSNLNDKIIVCVSHSQFEFPNRFLSIESGVVISQAH